MNKSTAAEHPFSRLELLIGSKSLMALSAARVIVFGVGGVGSWCAEALVRSGIARLTIVDSDVVNVTNINRQLQAAPMSVGKSKVEELARRLREINPAAEITARHEIYHRERKEEFDLSGYDYVIDAIDSLSSKVELIAHAFEAGVVVFSALGAACRVDPTRIQVGSIWKSNNCRLGRFVRKRLRRRGFKGDFLCVWSDEQCFCSNNNIDADGKTGIDDDIYDDDVCVSDNINANINDCLTNKTINGSTVSVTGVFGFMLSGLVIQDVMSKQS